MTTSRPLPTLLCGALLLAGCGDGSGPDDPPVADCVATSATALEVGEYRIIDAAQEGCVVVPGSGPEGAEHLYVALVGEGGEAPGGVTADYRLEGGVGGAVAARSQARLDRRSGGAAAGFHDLLRQRERELAAAGGGPALSRASRPAAVVPPSVGEERTFKVCATTQCNSFVDVTATARAVGDRVAIFLDDEAPAGGYTVFDLEQVASLFDEHLYPIDTAAFGRESDLDANEVVVVLLTPRINQLSPNCNTTGTVILGYFFGLDLLPSQANSNAGEIFYGLVPDPDNPACDITKDYATGNLPPVFMHEFQHMISFNQHVLVAGAPATEDTWLGEGLSHFAEELGGRLVPDAECQPLFVNCETQFTRSNIANAYDYLNDPEASFLIEPGSSQGDLAERGANWLFVRWLADHFASEQPEGHDFTRSLVETRNRGAVNVEAETGEPFEELVAQWQLANYLENLPGFTPQDSRLQYTSWNLRDLYRENFELGVFGKPYPLTPDSTRTGEYSRTGVLRGGSGRHVRIVQPGTQAPVEFRLTGDDGNTLLPETVVPRIALVRIR